MRSILSGIQKFVQSTPQSDSVSESSQQPKSSSLVMNKSESGLQSPQRTQFGDSKMVRNESVTASDVQSRSPQRTEIGDPEKAIMVIREHQTEGKASVEQVASPIPPVIVELTDDGDSSVAPQCSQPKKTNAVQLPRSLMHRNLCKLLELELHLCRLD